MTVQVQVGFMLGFIGILILTAAWWTESKRNDHTDLELAQIRDHLGIRESAVPEPEPADAQVGIISRQYGGWVFNFREEHPDARQADQALERVSRSPAQGDEQDQGSEDRQQQETP